MSGTYEMCSLKFFLSYMLGYDEPPHIKTCQGTMVHKVMEILAKIKLAQQNGKKSVEDEATGRFYLKKYSIEKIITQVYDYYKTAFTHKEWTSEEFVTVRKWVFKALEFNDGEYNPLNQDIVAPENNFSYRLDDTDLLGLQLNGTIDLVTRFNHNTLHIVDYKTGKRVNWGTGKTKEYADLEKDFQLNFYHVAARHLFPDVENMMITIYYINDGGPYTIPFGKCDIQRAIDNVKELVKNIETRTPEKRRGFWCKFCNYSKTTFEKEEMPVIINNGEKGCHFTKIGEPMCKCDTISYMLRHRSIDCVIDNMTKPGFDNSVYQAPGAI